MPNNLGKYLHPKKARTTDIRLYSPEEQAERDARMRGAALDRALNEKRQDALYKPRNVVKKLNK